MQKPKKMFSPHSDKPLGSKVQLVATNGCVPDPQALPDLKKGRRDGRFPGLRVFAHPPRPSQNNAFQWTMERRLSAYSCGYSAGLELKSSHRLPFYPQI
jgi:hypothetical protein